MSGFVPDFINKDHYVLFNGKKAVVTSVFAGPDNDGLVVQLDGMRQEFNGQAIKPLPAYKARLPKHIKVGNVAEVDNGRLVFIERVWMKQKKDSSASEVRIDISSSAVSRKVGAVRPVSPKNHAAADEMMRHREDSMKDQKKTATKRRQFFKANQRLKDLL
jgi:hypothetical protein